MKKQIESQEQWRQVRAYKTINETISEEAFYKIRKCEVDILSISTKINSRLRIDVENEKYGSLSKK
jgi:hypothetical protein